MSKSKITNEEEALVAVRQDGYALQYVPENLKTAELCHEAVKQAIEDTLESVPEALHNEVRRTFKSSK